MRIGFLLSPNRQVTIHNSVSAQQEDPALQQSYAISSKLIVDDRDRQVTK